MLRHGINSESEHKQAELAKKTQRELILNGEVKEEDDLDCSSKDSVETDNASNNPCESNGDSKSSTTDTTNASEVDASTTSNTGNDNNNSNNRELVKDRTSPSLQPTLDDTKNPSNVLKSDRVVVEEQTSKDDTRTEKAAKGHDKDEPLDIKKEKEDTPGLDKDVKEDSQSVNSSIDKGCGADKDDNDVTQNGDSKASSGLDKNADSSQSDIDDDSKPPVQGIKQECTESDVTVKKESNTEVEQHSSQKETETTGEHNGEDSKQDAVKPPASQGKVMTAGDDVETKPTPANPRPDASWICWSPPRPTTQLPQREKVLPDIEGFELVCDTVEALRGLIKKFSGEPEEIVIPAKGKKKKRV